MPQRLQGARVRMSLKPRLFFFACMVTQIPQRQQGLETGWAQAHFFPPLFHYLLIIIYRLVRTATTRHPNATTTTRGPSPDESQAPDTFFACTVTQIPQRQQGLETGCVSSPGTFFPPLFHYLLILTFRLTGHISIPDNFFLFIFIIITYRWLFTGLGVWPSGHRHKP
jgi:hypothetical protein